jgi:1-acyl-sn-glycerol-3-phosphate acyltransferase
VLPVYIKGASDILPPGSPVSEPAPVTVRIGKPFEFADGASIPEAKARMEAEIKALAGDDLIVLEHSENEAA